MINIFDRIVQYPNRVKLTPVAGQTDTYDVSKITGIVTKEGTPINRTLLMGMQGFIGNTIVFNIAGRTVTETNAQGDIKVTSWNVGGNIITEQFTSAGMTITKTTTFSGDGLTITTEVIS